MYDIVIIEVRGGIAVATTIPKNVQVLIRDYDTDGADEVEIDENGDSYTATCS